ncbi:MAG: LolA-like protein [Acidimicrobiales bacterium]
MATEPDAWNEAPEADEMVLPAGTERRRLWLPVSLAAAIALVVGALGILGLAARDGQGTDLANGPDRLLALAADRMTSLGTARLSLTGTLEFTTRVPAAPRPPAATPLTVPPLPAPPDLSGFPAPYRREVERRLRSWQESNRQQLRKALSEAHRITTSTATRSTSVEVSTGVVLDGAAELAAPDRLHIRGSVRVAGAVSQPYEITVTGGQVLLHRPDGAWDRVAGAVGSVATVVLDPQATATLLRSPVGAVEDRGTEGGPDGEVRHLRFSVAATSLAVDPAPGDQSWTIDARMGEADHVLRQMTLASQGGTPASGSAPRHWQVQLELRLSDPGAPVAVSAPPASEVRGVASRPSGGPGDLLFPLPVGGPGPDASGTAQR